MVLTWSWWCLWWGCTGGSCGGVTGTPKPASIVGQAQTTADTLSYLSRAGISVLGLNCTIKMNWYHVTLLVFWAGGPPDWCCLWCRWWHSLNTEGSWSWYLCPWQGVVMNFKVPPNPKHSYFYDFPAWGLVFVGDGVCFTLFLTVSLELSFPGVYFSGYLNCSMNTWGFYQADVQSSQHYTNGRSWAFSDLKE